MTTKDVQYRVTVDASQAERGFKSAERSAAVFERELKKLEAQKARVDQAFGQGLLVAGAAIAAGLVVATKAAIEWESAWAGVAKVIEGSPEELAALEGELRGLAKTLPQTHTEIAGVAAAAGQLGIKRQDIADFTRVMIDMGVSTNLAAEDAAFALARMMNIMQTAPEDVRRLGSAIVDLGNNSATTEAEIVEMALRISGAGKAIGLSEADVLGFSAALSSVGVQAESGGSSISRAFVKIDSAVRGGSEKLEIFAGVAGMTAEEFRQAYEQDAANAIRIFVEGLGTIQRSGGDVFAVLESLTMGDIRLRDAMLRLANAGDLLNRSLETGAQAWDENIALTEEAERRYGTTEAKLQIARNQLVDFAIDIGNTFLPALGAAADGLGGLAALLGGLPGPAKTTLAIVGSLAAAFMLAGGAALIAVPKIAAYKAAIDTLAASEGRLAAATVATSKVMGRTVGILGGPWGLALAGGAAILGVFAGQQAAARARAKEFAETLDDTTGALTENTRVLAAHKLEEKGALEAAQQLGFDLSTLTDVVLGQEDAVREYGAAWADAKERFQKFGTKDITKEEIDAWNELKPVIESVTKDVDEAEQAWKRQSDAVGSATEATKEMTPEQQALADSFGVGAQEAEKLADEIGDLGKELDRLFGVIFGVEEASDALERQYKALSETIKENGASVEGNSEKALDNRDAVRDLIRADYDLITAMAEARSSTTELDEATERARQRFIKQMTQLGFTKKEAERLAQAYDEIPEVVKATIKTPGAQQALSDVLRLQASLNALSSRTYSATVIRQQLQGMPTPGLQHGGLVPGPSHPVDSVPARLTGGEFVVRRAVTQQNIAALRALNTTGRLPVSQQPVKVNLRVSSGGARLDDVLVDILQRAVDVEAGGDASRFFG